MTRVVGCIILFAGILVGCEKEPYLIPDIESTALLIVPDGFPVPEFPEDNQLTQARWELGKKLFYDPIMSADGQVSCASCHPQQYAFGDYIPLSPGSNMAPGVRNTPTIANVAYHPYFTRDGGVPTLEMQILVPIQEHNEFNSNILEIAERMMEEDDYIAMSNEAYGEDPSAFAITRALACFERTLISGNSLYDQYLRGTAELNSDELAGMDLFFSEEINCASCHGGFNFTEYAFENNGLYSWYEDPGRYRLTKDPADSGRFKVTTLRNIEVTKPYMHDGSKPDLDSVIDHYASGGAGHSNQSSLIAGFEISDEQKGQLIDFLHTLTDNEFLENEHFQP